MCGFVNIVAAGVGMVREESRKKTRSVVFTFIIDNISRVMN